MAQTEQVTSVPASVAHPTFIDIVLDETGSMSAPQTKAGFDDFITDQKTMDGQCYLTLTKFDSSGIKTPYENLSLHSVPPLSFFPGSTTNLYDVVGKRVSEVKDLSGRRLVVVITDGCDNASREFSAEKVKTLVTEARSKGISFLYFGADTRASEIGQSMGFTASEITVFRANEIRETMAVASNATRAFRAS